MVRYSKLPFRALVRDYSVDLTFTPMLVAKEFTRHHAARYTDFSTNEDDRPVIAQFAAKDAVTLARAAEMVFPYVDGVDLNCGCPQTWACQEGIGAGLMQHPETVRDMVRGVKARLGQEFCVSVKIRIHADLRFFWCRLGLTDRETVELVRRVESVGVDFISVHGRLKNQRSSTPPNLDAIELVKSTVQCPVVANGDVYSLKDVETIVEKTKVDGKWGLEGWLIVGVMAARGILENPGLYAGFESTPWGCVERYVNYALSYGSNCHIFQHHLSEMTRVMFNKKGIPSLRVVLTVEHRELNELKSVVEVIDWLDDLFVLRREGEKGYGLSGSIDAQRL
jgi:tRNA-dihydrouridine synthase 4